MFEKLKKIVHVVVGPSIEEKDAEMALRELRELREAIAKEPVVPDGYVTVKKDDLLELSAKLVLEQKKSAQFFDLIERVIAQRDERWGMFLTHSSEHQQAQGALEESILGLRVMLGNAVKELNQYRTKAGVKTIDRPVDLLGVPIGTAEQFKEHMKKLRESVTPTIDGIAERNRIVAEDGGMTIDLVTGHNDDSIAPPS